MFVCLESQNRFEARLTLFVRLFVVVSQFEMISKSLTSSEREKERERERENARESERETRITSDALKIFFLRCFLIFQ